MKYKRDFLPYLAGIFIYTVFGFSFLFTKNSLEIMSPMQILSFRFTIAAVLISILNVSGIVKINLKGKRIGSLIILSLTQPIAYFLFETIGVKLTSTSETGMMIALIPVVVTIFAAIFLKEKPSSMQIISILLSVTGVIFIILIKGISDVRPNYFGLLAIMGAVFSAGVYNIMSRKMSVHYKPLEITYIMMWVGALTFNGLAVIQGLINGNLNSYLNPLFSLNSWIPILYLGVLSSVGAFFMMNYMLSRLTASQSAVFTNLATLVSILAGVTLKGESFYWFQGVGGAMILLGVWGTNYFSPKPFEVSENNHELKNYDI